MQIHPKLQRILPPSPPLPFQDREDQNEQKSLSIDDFKIDTKLGSGAYGEVFRVTHTATDQVYALKAISKELIKKYNVSSQVRTEARIMYSLQHPNIVSLKTHFEDARNVYLVLELCSEGQLCDKVKIRGRLDEASSAAYIADLVTALEYIHNREPRIIHRDIKPENLLISENGVLKLADFGCSNFKEMHGDARETFCGTFEYLAPEMINCVGHTEKVDIWAVGVLIYELLVGRSPFVPIDAKDRAEFRRRIRSNIIKRRIMYPAGFPPLAKDLTSKLLKSSPGDRLGIQEIKNHPWFAGFGLFTESDRKRRQKDLEESMKVSLALCDEGNGLIGYEVEKNFVSSHEVSSMGSCKSTQTAMSFINFDMVATVAESTVMGLHQGYEGKTEVFERGEFFIDDKKENVLTEMGKNHQNLGTESLLAEDGKVDKKLDTFDDVRERKNDSLKEEQDAAQNLRKLIENEINLKIETKDQKIARLQNEVKQLKSELSKLKSEQTQGRLLTGLSLKKHNLMIDENEQLKTKNREMLKSLHQKDTKIDALELQLVEIQNLRKSNLKLKSATKALQDTINAKNEELEQKSERINTEKNEIQKQLKEYSERIDEYESKLNIRSKENNELVIRQMLEYTAESYDCIKSTLREHIKKSAEITLLKDQLKEVTHKLKMADLVARREAEDAKIKLSDEFEEKISEIQKKYKTQIFGLKKEFNERDTELKTENKLKEKNLILARHEIEKLTAELECLRLSQRNFKDLSETIESQVVVVKAKEVEIGSLNERVKELCEKVKSLKADNARLVNQPRQVS